MKFEVCIGSWYAYNNNTDLAYGSKFIDFSEYNSWEEIEEELVNEGFEIPGKDEELFIQDIDFDFGDFDADSLHPQRLFNLLKNSGIMENESAYNEALAFMEVYSFNDLEDRVERNGLDWNDGISFYNSTDETDVGYSIFMDNFEGAVDSRILEQILHYVDLKKYLRENEYTKTQYGYICVWE